MKTEEYKVDISKIRIDDSYQRTLRKSWVDTLVKNYDESKVNQIVLSAHSDGTYFCIDGQHTVEATRIVKGEHAELSAKVFFNLSAEDEAQLFYSYNTDRKALTSSDRIRARYAMGEKLVVNYFNTLDEIGAKWSFTTKKTDVGKRTFINHSLIIKAFETVGAENAKRAFKIAMESDHYYAQVVSGLMFLLYKIPEIKTKRLIEKLSAVPDSVIVRTAYSVSDSIGYSNSSVKSGAVHSGGVPSTTRIYAKTIAVIYNKGLSTNKVDINAI